MNYGNHKLDDYLLPDAEALDEFELFEDGMDDALTGDALHVSEEF